MKRQVGVALLLAWVGVFSLAGPSEAIKFRYENLGTLGGSQTYPGFWGKEAGINDAGQVVGKSYTIGGALHAFVKSPGQTMVDLDNMPGSTGSHAPCINKGGLIGGWFTDGSGDHACTWTLSGGIYGLDSLGGISSQIQGLNEAGYLVGTAHDNGYHAYVVPLGDNPQDLGVLSGFPSTIATAINSSRTIVGYSWDNYGNRTACFWSPSGGGYTAAASLFGVPDSTAWAINTSGEAVGFVWVSPGVTHAVLKSPGKPMQDLGGLVGYGSQALDINDSSWIVGHSMPHGEWVATLWTPGGGPQDLNNLVVNLPPGVTLRQAHAINNRGEIVGYTDNSVFKLTPIAEPPLSLLLLD
jgi:probable HAF family extracellular repeat protein